MHLHNALLLGLLYNSSPGVPGPSSSALGSAKSNARKAAAGGGRGAGLDDEDGEGPRKRVRLLVSGLNRKERLRLKTLGKAGKGGLLGAAAHANAGGAHGGNGSSAASASANGNGAAAAVGAAASAAAAGGAGGLGEKSSSSNNLDWAGAGADILEKKRKDEERRRTVEEKKRYREAHTAIGSKAWKPELLKQTEAIEFARGKLATCEHPPGLSSAARRLNANEYPIHLPQRYNKHCREASRIRSASAQRSCRPSTRSGIA